MIKNILDAIERFETIVIHRHERPDPDAIGSQLGLAQVIREQYPSKNVYAVGEAEPSLAFLGEMDVISDEQYTGALVIVCDTANTERISDQRYDQGAALIKIDHHPNDEPYGDIVWVETTYSSTSEMIVELIVQGQKLGYALSSESALLLYAGIVGDTGRFRYSNTSADTLKRTSLLVEQRFDQNAFYSELHKKDLKMTRLQGYVLQHFEIKEGHLGIMRLTKDILKQFDVTSNESSQLVNTFSDVEGLKAWVFFVEEEDKIRVRLRSKGPVINTIATQHGGGGHPMASGATAYSWEETEEIIEKLLKACRA
ncbi:DHH family phosphoesterase [Halalkalibacter nanhaiisediminis]|uniref:Phosphoesterase RecJ-like protein n=1 Tax=Halalkalibacter nanhaiisediminis TaxID=688079 RepID=A0A562QJN7_9BACI|nr:bifunctional oligoribonuclease/PAP phosphatase NrnA [Halalkalibacter nanhaiisediminis]TWI56977.1 phosphoesterase RecJ-like protein [Halalkalibacter nanhaiisediminis]